MLAILFSQLMGLVRSILVASAFPAAEHTYTIPEEELSLFNASTQTAEERERAPDGDR